jgi:hypothetical protein
MRGSSAKGLGRDEVTIQALPSFPGKTLIIVEGYGSPVVNTSIFFDFLPAWLSRIRSRRISPGISL